MLTSRKEARARVKAIKTYEELKSHVDSLNLTDEEKEIALMVYAKGWTRQKIAMETGYSVRQIARKIAKINDKI